MARFYHRCFLVLSLLGCAGGGLANNAALSGGEPVETTFKVPPRSINDITRMLRDYGQHADLVKSLQATADAPVPATADKAALFNFYLARGQAAAELGRVGQQLDDLRLAIDNGQTGRAEYARTLRLLAYAEAIGGNFVTAMRLVDDSIRNVPPQSTGQLTGAYSMAVALASQVGDLAAAERYLGQLESTLVFLKSRTAWSTWSHFWLGSYEKARGDYFRLSGKHVEAEGAYRRALREVDLALVDLPALRRSGADAPTPEVMASMAEGVERSIALALLGQAKVVEAEAAARRAVEKTLKRAGNAAPDVARGLRVLASVLAEQGRYAESARLSEAALEVLLRSGAAPASLPIIGARQANLAAQVALGNDQAALAIFETLKASVADNPELAAKVLRGDLDVVLAWLRTGQAGAAEQMASGMLEAAIQQQGAKSIRAAEIKGFHAMALADLGREGEALAAFRQAVPVLVERVSNDNEAETVSTRRQARLVAIIERYVRLLAVMSEKGSLPPQFDAANEAFMLADFARGSSVQRALTRSAARAAIKDPALAELARQEQDAQRRANSLNELLSQLLAAAPDQQLPAIQAKIRSDIVELRQTRERLKKEIGQRFPDYARLVDPPPISVADVRKMLHPGEVLLSWYFSGQGGQVWAIAADGRVTFAPLPVGRPDMARDVAQLRQALNPDVPTIDMIPAFDVKVAHRLYRNLLAPVENVLAGAKVLLAVPHAELGQLPLSLLLTRPVEAPGKTAVPFAGYRELPWLMRQMAVAQLPSVTALSSLRRLPPGDPGRLPFIGFGDPFFSEEQAGQAERKAASTEVAMRGVPLRLRNVPRTQAVDSAELALLPRLPDTAQEIRDIAGALGADVSRDIFLHRAASEKTVFETNLANRRVVMFATHGLVPGELDGLTQPALALSAPKVAGGEGDGLLTQEEILGLKLNADWVVLSACNTAAGEGSGTEAVSGLGRAFFYAGARALLVSNWPVETEASRTLMTDLFRRQSAADMTKAEALRQAMAGMLDGPGKLDPRSGKPVFSYAHPLFWAPFVLVGD